MHIAMFNRKPTAFYQDITGVDHHLADHLHRDVYRRHRVARSSPARRRNRNLPAARSACGSTSRAWRTSERCPGGACRAAAAESDRRETTHPRVTRCVRFLTQPRSRPRSKLSDATNGDPTGVACCSRPNVDCGAAGTLEMPEWDVSLVTDMEGLFRDKADFNADISAWDTSQVTNMEACSMRHRVQPRHRLVGYLAGHETWGTCSKARTRSTKTSARGIQRR